jgi:hypothetical protein
VVGERESDSMYFHDDFEEDEDFGGDFEEDPNFDDEEDMY